LAIGPDEGGSDDTMITAVGTYFHWMETYRSIAAQPLPHASPNLPPQREGGYVALMEACLAVLRGGGAQPDADAIYRPALPNLWRVPDAINRIRRLPVSVKVVAALFP
jgi:hypothetical protein